MAFFPSAPDADMKRTLAREPAIGIPFSQLNEAVMRGDAPFSAGERELLAAYVSALNGCDYCQCEHVALATAFGLPAGLLAQLLQMWTRPRCPRGCVPPFTHSVAQPVEGPSL
jgi:AhpD family alkylhydroperoxidase